MDITDRLRAPVAADDVVSVIQLQAAAEMAADEIERLRLSLRLLRDEVREAVDRADLREAP